MIICIKKLFLDRFERLVRKNGVLFEATIKALFNLKNEVQSEGLNIEYLKGSDFLSVRVTRDYRIIFYREGDFAYLSYFGNHKEAYNWANTNKTIKYKDDFVGYWNSEGYVRVKEEEQTEEEYSGFNREFQLRLQACLNGQEVLEVCEGLAPEYKEKILSRGIVDNIRENYSSDILVIEDDDELKRALESPFEEWMVFLHPVQKRIIEFPRDKNLVICGGPGTGKTVSLVHRLVETKKQNKECLIISKSDATIDVIKEMVSQLDEGLMLNTMLMDEIDEINIEILFKQYDFFFFDELQDIEKKECRLLIDAFQKNPSKHFTIAYDLNQAIYTTKNKKEIYDFTSLADEKIILDYNYRCTSEVFLAAAEFIRYQFDRLKEDTFEMNFALVGNEIECVSESGSELDLAIEEYVFENNLLNCGDWAIVFVGYYNNNMYDLIKNKFPDNVFNVMECKGMDFKTGCVVIYNEDFDVDNKIGFKEFNAQSYVAITRFRDSLKMFLIYEKYEDTPQKIMANIHNNTSNKKRYENNKDELQLKKMNKKKEEKKDKNRKLAIKQELSEDDYKKDDYNDYY